MTPRPVKQMARKMWHRYPSTTLFLVYISFVVTLLLALRVTCYG